MSCELSLDQITALASQLRTQVAAQRRRVPHARAELGSIEEAYRVQHAYQQLLEQEGFGDIVGYKIALTSQAMQQMVGVDHPLAGAIFEKVVESAGGEITLSDFRRLGLEFEIAVKLGDDLGPQPGGHSVDSVAAAVLAIAPAFELVEDRDADYAKIDAYSLIAENCWNAGVILGDFRKDIDVSKLPDLPTSLKINDTPVDQSLVGDVMGHPFEVVAWVANLLLDQGRQLSRGMIVMTGSSMKTQFPTAGDEFHFSVETLGTVSVKTE